MDYEPELAKLVDIQYLTDESKRKLNNIYLNPLTGVIPSKLIRFINEVSTSFNTDIIATVAKSDRTRLIKVLIGFDQYFNKVNDSYFQKFVRSARYVMSIDLMIRSSKIRLNFLYDEEDDGYISAILHATHTFCYTIDYNYNGLVIDIALDNNIRSYDIPQDISNDDTFKYLQSRSMAFNVSGVTIRGDKHIILTKKEDIIKLLFHELSHYAGIERNLDYEIVNPYNNIPAKTLNINEAYTEFISILFSTAYESIHLWNVNRDRLPLDDDLYILYQTLLQTETQYSIYLSASILKIFGYDKDTWRSFFENDSNKIMSSPIYTFEYILMRTSLMLNIDSIIDAIDDDLGVNNSETIKKYILPNDNMFIQLSTYMRTNNYDNNISYLLVDFDWNDI